MGGENGGGWTGKGIGMGRKMRRENKGRKEKGMESKKEGKAKRMRFGKGGGNLEINGMRKERKMKRK